MTTLARRSLLASASTALLGAGPSRARAQGAYPSRPVRIIVPWRPGGGVDVLARAIQPALSERLAQTVVIENIGTGSGRVGTQTASRAAPDGYTLLQDLVAGTIDVGMVTFVAAAQQARAGQLVPLVVTSAARPKLFPEVPTASETIAPRFLKTTWMGLFAPAGTPANIIDRVHAATAAVLGDLAVVERLATLGFDPAGLDPTAFGQLFDETIATFADIAVARGIRAGG
jgi:tripartite-type tricarboxylate transporter receptor subunit TctC